MQPGARYKFPTTRCCFSTRSDVARYKFLTPGVVLPKRARARAPMYVARAPMSLALRCRSRSDVVRVLSSPTGGTY